ncbi:hypothetical protein PP914_gp012 [Arthrobacter phage Qui]|uniref:Uncharacterized protein n=1 Tax=Arthrobacter phage Qui TaxID=2603260 RepID=A0A5B8WG96_9CAUD|nr:hypothetical protein PP914_gp012 [Arthrobacter phage Qui]QED11503.1 hypothetical protein SEA_QUI_12 [Arthrobacter phage Qui]QOC56334.1 hypothetical protein SEA_PAELLA_12 [Arthrobacter phage Paella]
MSVKPPVVGKAIWQLTDNVLACLHSSGGARRTTHGGS